MATLWYLINLTSNPLHKMICFSDPIPKVQGTPKELTRKSVPKPPSMLSPIRPVAPDTKPPPSPAKDMKRQLSDTTLKKAANPVAMGTKEPGWYKQMFQDFQNTVDECFPGGQLVNFLVTLLSALSTSLSLSRQLYQLPCHSH